MDPRELRLLKKELVAKEQAARASEERTLRLIQQVSGLRQRIFKIECHDAQEAKPKESKAPATPKLSAAANRALTEKKLSAAEAEAIHEQGA